MRVMVVGASGTIGSAVVAALGSGHDIIRVSRRGPVPMDLDAAPLTLPPAVTELDAVVCCAASAPMAPLHGSTDEAFFRGVSGKLLGQLRLVRVVTPHVLDGGSITLTSGRFTAPTRDSSLGALVNAGLEQFVRVAALEMPRGIRLNVVSPPWVRGPADDTQEGLPAADVAAAYVRLLSSAASGETVVPVPSGTGDKPSTGR